MASGNKIDSKEQQAVAELHAERAAALRRQNDVLEQAINTVAALRPVLDGRRKETK